MGVCGAVRAAGRPLHGALRAMIPQCLVDEARRLLAEGFTIEQLQKNEQFITAVLHATQVAIRTHHAEKLEALKNAMTNIAKGHGPDETWQQIYFGFIDSFTELHLRVLKWARSRYVPDDVERGVPLELLQDAIPTLRGNRELADTIWEDLGRRGLVQPEQLSGLASPSKNRIALTQKFTTNMGDALLRFVEDAA